MQKVSKAISFFLVILILVGCTPGIASYTPTKINSSPEANIDNTPTSPMAPVTTEANSPTAAPLPTATPDYTPTPDTRPLPEAWQQWPVIPDISARAIEIYQKGIALGNNPRALSKVGDCQSISEVLLGIYDNPAYLDVFKDQPNIQETINQFQGSFNRDGMAVEGGFNTAAVLSPIWANPQFCEAGETPLECEYRVHKPSIAIISLEVWWDGRTPERYEEYMRRIIEFFIDHGTLPILSTKADNVEGDHSINYTVAKLAYEYDLPLWNFWLAVQPLPYHGMDPDRDDGFHISPDTWSTRSYTALQVVDKVWHAANTIGSSTAVITPPSIGQIQGTAFNFPIITAADLQAMSIKNPLLIFGLSERISGSSLNRGVFVFEPTEKKVFQFLEDGYNLQDISRDGKSLLINKSNQLFLFDLTTDNSVELTSTFLPGTRSNALFTTDSLNVVYVSRLNGYSTIEILQINSQSKSQVITPNHLSPFELISVSDINHIYWKNIGCTETPICESGDVYVSNSNGEAKLLLDISMPISSPDGSQIIQTKTYENQLTPLQIMDIETDQPQNVMASENTYIDYAWSPDAQKIAALIAFRDSYTGKVTGIRQYLISLSDSSIVQTNDIPALNGRVSWSPDGSKIAEFNTLMSSQNTDIGKSQIGIFIIDVSSLNQSDYTSDTGIISDNFISITNLFWLP